MSKHKTYPSFFPAKQNSMLISCFLPAFFLFSGVSIIIASFIFLLNNLTDRYVLFTVPFILLGIVFVVIAWLNMSHNQFRHREDSKRFSERVNLNK